MLKRSYYYAILLLPSVFFSLSVHGQQKVLGLKEAESLAIVNYPSIKSKINQLNASKANLNEVKSENLPDLNFSAQQVYGTVNGQFGPSYGFKGFNVSSAGPNLASQNWNAGFGSLYLSNISWDFFSFGKAKEKVKIQNIAVSRDENDLAQEQFQHQIRVASSYLNLLAAQELTKAQKDNLNRAIELQKVVAARVRNGLNAGVDSSQANAEIASAKIALTNAQETEQEQSNLLAQYIGIQVPTYFVLDSSFISKTPNTVDAQKDSSLNYHPLLKYYQSRIAISKEQSNYLGTFNYPTFSIFGVFQGKGSGYGNNYGINQNDFTGSYLNGANPTRYNYLFGLGIIWNLTSPVRVHYQLQSQKFITEQYKNDFDLIDNQLKAQLKLSETRLSNALKNFHSAPEEVKAAKDAYTQKLVLYKNGLSNIVDFTQALYALNRAEVDNYIAANNVWQALLYKAAASGDFSLFINNF